MARSEFQKLQGRIKSADGPDDRRYYIGNVQNLCTWVLRDKRGNEVSPWHTSLQALLSWCNRNGYAQYVSPTSLMANPLIRVKRK